jgi:FMN-dependent NADH-azoreductase
MDEFLAADIIVIGAPMYNLGIPTQLKAWFDHVLVAGKTFRYGPNGVEGLVGDKRVVVALSRGGFYPEGGPSEHAAAHLLAMLAFIGITDVEVVTADGVAISAEQRTNALAAARAQVEQLEFEMLAA